MYSPGGPYIVVTPVVTSWAVAGQQVVFLHMYLQTRVTLRAFPVATPRGRSSKFPWRGTHIKAFNKVTKLRCHFSNEHISINVSHVVLQLAFAIHKLTQLQHPFPHFTYMNLSHRLTHEITLTHQDHR